jgi:uroporphyrin-III C-methyltransferase / precorrin-2 dehydrogenase / sirohydrochlorin ferrochelatase
MHSLPVFLRLAGRPVILIGDGATVQAKRRLLERAGADVVGEEHPAAIAIVAFEEDRDAEAAVARLRARGILINAVDRPALCDFTLPAIIDRDPVLVAIGTGGASAGLAKALRQRIEALLPASLGRLAEALHRARPAIRAHFPDPADRRRAIDAALDGPLDPLKERADDAVERWLAAPEAGEDAVITLTLRSADPDDLTLGEARWLAQADTLFHDGAPPAILARVRADAHIERIPADDVMPPSGITVILR